MDVILRIERFLIRAGKDECTKWKGCTCNGYPLIWYNGKLVRASHILWKRKHGVIPKGLDILHTCDNPTCLNLKHLYPGTDKQNRQDCIKRDRLPCAKLKVADVLSIRKSFHNRPTGMSGRRFSILTAPIFNVSVAAIKHVVYKQSWKEIG